MKLMIKIVMAGINMCCLIISLCYPNSATPISVLPLIVTTASWAVLSQGNDLSIHENKQKMGILIFSTVIAMMCIVIGLTCNINSNTELSDTGLSEQTKLNDYVVSFREDVALLGEKYFKYIYFALFAFISVSILILSEVVASYRSILHRSGENNNINFLISSKIKRSHK